VQVRGFRKLPVMPGEEALLAMDLGAAGWAARYLDQVVAGLPHGSEWACDDYIARPVDADMGVDGYEGRRPGPVRELPVGLARRSGRLV
jgi:hypothetical protein